MSLPLQIRSFQSEIFRSCIFDALKRQAAQSLSASASVNRAAKARKQLTQIVSSVYPELDNFPYVYFTAGVTEAIDHVLRVPDRIQVSAGEYRYVRFFPNVYVSSTSSPNTMFVSSPFSSTGRHLDLRAFGYSQKLIVDCSYLFASNLCHAPELPSNVDSLLFGFSKSHDLADLRLGAIVTKTKIPHLHIPQYDYGYVSSLMPSALETILSYPLNELWHQNESLDAVYASKGLTVNDTRLFALDNLGNRVPYYSVLC